MTIGEWGEVILSFADEDESAWSRPDDFDDVLQLDASDIGEEDYEASDPSRVSRFSLRAPSLRSRPSAPKRAQHALFYLLTIY